MPKHLNTSDLFSSNPGELLQRGNTRTDYQSDSAINSSQSFSSNATASQMMASQMENSQSSSFDLFSQMMSQQQGLSQQNENSSKFYMKYMSKPPLFQKESSKKHSLTRRRSFQEMQEFNREKAKDRDDRDLINTFIAIVKECADEVKHAASSIRKDVDSNIAETTKETAAVISKITNELSRYHKQLLAGLKTREDHEERVQELTEIIASKDARIEILESQVAAARKDRNEHLLKAMLDMYTEQQNVTRQHLDKMHEEQQNIKEQQTMLLRETEKSCATLSKVDAATHSKATSNNKVDSADGGGGRAFQQAPAPSAVPRAPDARKSHMSGPVWSGAEQSKMMSAQQGNFLPTNPISQEMPAQLNGPYVNQPYPQMSYIGSGGGQHAVEVSYPGRPQSYGSAMNTGNMNLNSSSHLFQNRPGSAQPLGHQAVVMQELPSAGVFQQASRYPSSVSQYQHQQGRNENHLQELQSVAPIGTCAKRQQRSSSYDNFANKFSSPNYTRDSNQLFSKKAVKPSPVAAIAPQVHKDPSDTESQETQPPPARQRKKPSRRGQGKTHFGSRKRTRKGSVASVQPQRKSARLTGRDGQDSGINNAIADTGERSRGASKVLSDATKKSKQAPRHTSHLFPPSNAAHKQQESPSVAESSCSEDSPPSQEWDEPVLSKMATASKPPFYRQQQAKVKQVQERSSSLRPKGPHKQSHLSSQYESSDEDDEYSFREETEVLPLKSSGKNKSLQSAARSKHGAQHIVDEVFSRRPLSTYTKPKLNRETPGKKCSGQLQINVGHARPKPGQHHYPKAETKYQPKRSKPEPAKVPVILDATQLYSDDDEDSSQEIYFSLKIPETHNSKTESWSSLMSPSVESQYPEQVVPGQQCVSSPEDSQLPVKSMMRRQIGRVHHKGRVATQSGRREEMKVNRKRRMISSSKFSLDNTFIQVSG